MDAMTVHELREKGLLVEHELYVCEKVMKLENGDENPYFVRGMVYVCEKSPNGRLGMAAQSGFVLTTTGSTFSPLLDDEDIVEISPSDTPFMDAFGLAFKEPDPEAETTGVSDGGATSYYDFPTGFSTLADLIDFKDMNFNIGNIFKAAYRLGRKKGVDRRYDLNKIIYFAQRELNKLN